MRIGKSQPTPLTPGGSHNRVAAGRGGGSSSWRARARLARGEDSEESRESEEGEKAVESGEAQGFGRAVVERVGEDHRGVDAFRGGGAQALQVQAGGGAVAVPAGGLGLPPSLRAAW